MQSSPRSNLVIISGPSGAGKSTVVRRLLNECEVPLKLSVSATTRKPRPEEVEGRDYYFLSREEFASRRERGDFLECMEVFGRGDWYGTLHSEVEDGLAAGYSVILEIDVQGALRVLEQKPDCVTIFLHPGSMEELERRLRSRGTESETSIQRRMEVARREMEFLSRYRFAVINRTIDQAVLEICEILKQCGGASDAR
jgi:guanylate kinase